MGLPIQLETARYKVGEAVDADWVGKYQKESLELAAAQMAVGLAAASDESPVNLLSERLVGFEEGADVQVEELLTPREQEFLPTARVVVNLVHLGASAGAQLV